jgi:hypothetical protein
LEPARRTVVPPIPALLRLAVMGMILPPIAPRRTLLQVPPPIAVRMTRFQVPVPLQRLCRPFAARLPPLMPMP